MRGLVTIKLRIHDVVKIIKSSSSRARLRQLQGELLTMQLFICLVALATVSSFNVGFNSRQNSMRSLKSLRMGDEYDYDLIIVGCGVGGHGAALHTKYAIAWWWLPNPNRSVQFGSVMIGKLR